ncbi:MAG: multiheme c-type cytochrome [Fidelibacterota bacterium]
MKKQFFLIPIVGITLMCSDGGKTAEPIKPLPIQTEFAVTDFQSAETCNSCHPQHYAEWAASMHAYSMQDPVWVNSQRGRQAFYADQGKDPGYLCLPCHSPVGFLTQGIPDLANLTADAITALPAPIREGVTCDACHGLTHLPRSSSIDPANGIFVGTEYNLYLDGTEYGRIDDPVDNEFHASAYHPDYGKSEFCRNCHDLFIGGVGAEVTYTEWSGSAFDAMGMECQTCHMPEYSGQAAVNGPVRDNLHRHYFPGVDQALIPDFPSKEEQLAAIEDLMLNAAELHLVTSLDTIPVDTAITLDFLVANLTGHNFPSSVTFVRQLWLDVAVIAGTDTVFRSGFLDDNLDIQDFHTDSTSLNDPQLALFNTVLYNAAGDSGLHHLSVEELVALSDYTLPTNGTRHASYQVDLTNVPAGDLTIIARLRLRAFPPFVLRANGLADQAVTQPIFEIDQKQYSLHIQGS